MSDPSQVIRALTPGDRALFQAHFERHRSESGRGDIHFMPFIPGDVEKPKGIDVDVLERSLLECDWQRCFVALSNSDEFIGHVDLKGDGLKTGLHRCELGIGIEQGYRGQGLGRRLMETAIAFARDSEILSWVDLKVFSHNEAGRALYRKLGFVEVGTVTDRFRIEGESIGDVIMTLDIRPPLADAQIAGGS